MDIKEALLSLLKDAGLTNIYSVKGKVISIDTDKRTCEVEPNNDDANLIDVKLQSSESGGTGVLFIPEENSDVIVHFLDVDEAYVTKTSKVSKVEIITENGEILLNGEELGGMIKINELTAKLNKLVGEIKSMKASLSLHTHAGVTIGTGITGAAAITGSFSNFKKSDYENEKVKHG